MDPLEHLLFILVAWTAQSFSPPFLISWILPIFGFLFLLIYSPVACMWVLLVAIEATAIVFICQNLSRKSPWRKYLPYLILPQFLFVDLHPIALGFSVETLAISFSTIRIFMTAKQLLGSRVKEEKSQCGWIFAAAFFLPALIVGPVFSGTSLRKCHRNPGSVQTNITDVRLIIAGLIMAAFANPAIGFAMSSISTTTGIPLWSLAPFLFIQLFLGFWGQSLIAEHSSKLCGYSLPLNFNQPWLAVDIKDFWSRWHRSMAAFIMQYIYLPLTLNGISPRSATLFAFLFMGIWHNLAPGYIIWGIVHGMLMVYWPFTTYKNLSRIMTLISVISLSYIANYGALS